MMKKTDKPASGAGEESFEQKLKALETVVTRLESDEVPLEEAITLYEQGMNLHKSCEKILADAQLRIEQLGKGDAAVPAASRRDDDESAF